MKPQFKREEIYLDLSKLSEEQQRKVISLLPIDNISAQIYFMGSYEDWNVIKKFTYLFFNDKKVWQICFSKREGKQELTYSQFLDMIGESEDKSKVIENSEKELINNDASSEEVVQVENYGWIKIESEKDLPKEDISCWWMDKKDGMILGKFLIENNNSDIDFILENATHYQPLIIPEPPKF